MNFLKEWKMDADVLWRIGYPYCGECGKNVSSLDMIILLNSIGCQINISRENAFFDVLKKKKHLLNLIYPIMKLELFILQESIMIKLGIYY